MDKRRGHVKTSRPPGFLSLRGAPLWRDRRLSDQSFPMGNRNPSRASRANLYRPSCFSLSNRRATWGPSRAGRNFANPGTPIRQNTHHLRASCGSMTPLWCMNGTAAWRKNSETILGEFLIGSYLGMFVPCEGSATGSLLSPTTQSFKLSIGSKAPVHVFRERTLKATMLIASSVNCHRLQRLKPKISGDSASGCSSKIAALHNAEGQTAPLGRVPPAASKY